MVNMDGISDGFETWPDWIICLRLISPLLLKKPIFDISITYNLDQIILKLADKVDLDEMLDKFVNCPDQIIYYSVTSTRWLKTPIFNIVFGTTPSVLIRSS